MTLVVRRPGVVLLDLILGTTLLAVTGIALISLLIQHFETVDLLRNRERKITLASEQLERMSAFWTAHDFDAHIGQFRAGAFDALITPVAPSLFDVTVADTLTGVVLLKTTFYAADTSDANP